MQFVNFYDLDPQLVGQNCDAYVDDYNAYADGANAAATTTTKSTAINIRRRGSRYCRYSPKVSFLIDI